MSFLVRSIAFIAPLLLIVDPAFASEGEFLGTSAAAAFAMAIASLGGALGQGKVASSALDGISRNPGASGQMFTPFILGLVFVESLVIFAFVICYLLIG